MSRYNTQKKNYLQPTSQEYSCSVSKLAENSAAIKYNLLIEKNNQVHNSTSLSSHNLSNDYISESSVRNIILQLTLQ